MKILKKKLFFPLLFCLLIFLNGCVRYDVGINFNDQHHGQIVQHITLGQQLTSLSQTEAQKWLDSIEARAKKLQGKAKKLSSQEMIVTIPFSNGQDLAKKFNQFFNPLPEENAKKLSEEDLDIIQLESEMKVKQSNLLLAEREKINLNVDLRGLGVLSNQGNVIISPGALLDLELALNTPWFVQPILTENGLNPDTNISNKQVVWHLIPGQINTLEAVIWIPSWLGVGTVVIILLMIAGFFLKYGHFPGVNPQ